MKIKNWNSISRVKSPKWNGWKILDFYESINVSIDESEKYILSILEENFHLTKHLESQI